MYVKLKLAPNSLFAILLRSPWWWSLLVFAAIVGLCAAMLPPAYQALGPMAGFPFLVVCAIAAKRQWQAPKTTHIQSTLDAALACTWPAFEQQLSARWTQAGFEVHRITNQHQQHADLRLHQGSQCTLVSARRWKALNHGIQPLRDLHACMLRGSATQGIYIAAQGTVSDAAQTFAQTHSIRILQSTALAEWLLGAA